jgi:rhamnogalacturonyl hydrolase YesR
MVLLGTTVSSRALAQSGTGDGRDLQTRIDAIARLAREPRIVSAAGVTRDETPLLTLENPSPFDPTATGRRMVIVGGLDGDETSARIVLDAVRWFKTTASDRDRRDWVVSALPLADPRGHARTRPYTFPPVKGFFDDAEQPESRYVWRWVTYQAPDLVVEVRAGQQMKIQGAEQSDSLPAGSLAAAVAAGSNGSGLGPVPAVLVTARESDGARMMRDVLSRAPDRRSTLREAIGHRISREPLALARVLAGRYPEAPGMNYIPALAWVHTLKLASITGDDSLRAKVLQQVQPWVAGGKPLFGDRIQLNVVAGTMIFAELARSRDRTSEAAATLAAEGVARAAAEKAPGVSQYGAGWTDDMFMATVVPARMANSQALDTSARLLTEYARRLQRPDGLFNHAADAPAAWGRGNGFAAFGLIETLAALPESHPARASILGIYRRLMAAMKTRQAPDGMWRQVVDIPGSYREESVTAQTLTAMARGIRLGWIDTSYMPVVQRAWRALLAHVLDDGTVVDVCTSTGAGPTRRYYLDRPAILGADDRGGAMALGAALEMYELSTSR